MKISYRNGSGNARITSYPHVIEVNGVDDLRTAAQEDHVCGTFANGKRGIRAFQECDCIMMDCDNNETEDALEMQVPADVQEAFPGVAFYVVYSRNHMRDKSGLSARPRFHVYFPLSQTITDAKAVETLKRRVYDEYPAFDGNALDAARFFFGVEEPKVEYHAGALTVDAFVELLDSSTNEIPEGQRNSTLSRYAGQVFKRLGDTEEAAERVHEANEKRCVPPLDADEVETIIGSARRSYLEKVSKDPNYIPPDEYAAMDFADRSKRKKAVTTDTIKQVLREMGISVRLNVISGRVDIDGMPDDLSSTNAPNTLPVLIRDYLVKRGRSGAMQTITDCISVIADANRYNPVADMLTAAKWDGEDRLSEVLHILGIEDNKRECVYVVKWLHQTVAMALNDEKNPHGADGVLVLQGAQGVGKTLFFRSIAAKAQWFAEGVSIDTSDRDTIMKAVTYWIAELGELDSTLKREQVALKAFITTAEDTYRAPYARVQTRNPRRMSLAATVNPGEFLCDDTGTRRFWVVHVEHIDTARLLALSEEWYMQLWRQVYEQLYLKDAQGFRLTAAEREELQRANMQHNKRLPGETEILDKLDWDASSGWDWYRTTDIKENLHLNIDTRQIGRALTRIAERDPRVEQRIEHGIRKYWLPQRRGGIEYQQRIGNALRDFAETETRMH